MASADRHEAAVAQEKTQRLEDKVEVLKKEMARLKRLEVRILEAPDQQRPSGAATPATRQR